MIWEEKATEKYFIVYIIKNLKDHGTALMETKPIQLYTNENRL